MECSRYQTSKFFFLIVNLMSVMFNVLFLKLPLTFSQKVATRGTYPTFCFRDIIPLDPRSHMCDVHVWLCDPMVWPTRLLCPWHSPDKNTPHFLQWGIFLTQGSNHCLLRPLHWQMDSLPVCHLRSPGPRWRTTKIKHPPTMLLRSFPLQTNMVNIRKCCQSVREYCC